MKTLEELRAAHAATTQGEWFSWEQENNGYVHTYIGMESGTRSCIVADLHAAKLHGEQAGNRDFIALAHNEWHALLDEIEALREELQHQRFITFALLEQFKGFAQDIVNSYDDTGCDGCGVVDQSINEKAIKIADRPAEGNLDCAGQLETLTNGMKSLKIERGKLRNELATLTEAARAVRDNWESGDLAGAVSRLSGLLED